MSQIEAAGISTENVPACPVCGARPSGPLYRNVTDRLFGAAGRWNLDECQVCGTVYLNPRPTREAIGRVYTHAYAQRKPVAQARPPTASRRLRRSVRAGFLANRHGYLNGVGWWQRALALPMSLLPTWRDQWSFSVMELPYTRNGRLLDVGCGLGDFLADMSRLDWQAEGVETDPQVRQICTDRGLHVSGGTLESQRFSDDSFDAITAKHVIEHVHEPTGFLRECARILKPGGRLVILTPNLRSLGHHVFGEAWIGLDAPRHLVLFTGESLRRATEQAGLRVSRLWSTARPSGFTWRVSYEIRRRGRSSYSTRTSLTQRLLERASDKVVRLALLGNSRAGDELAMVATKE